MSFKETLGRVAKNPQLKVSASELASLAHMGLVKATVSGWRLTDIGRDCLKMWTKIEAVKPTSPLLRDRGHCQDCGSELIRKFVGRPLKRCDRCRKRHLREYNAEWVRKKRGVYPRRPYRRRVLTP